MTDAAFLDPIRAAPADDLPRLVYADYLDERSDPRGRFIQVQCLLARLDPADPARGDLEAEEWALLNAHEPDWLGDLPAGVQEWEFRRGFVEQAIVADAAWADHGAALAERWLVRDLEVTHTGTVAPWDLVRRWPWTDHTARVESLRLASVPFGDDHLAGWLFRLPDTRLTALAFEQARFGGRSWRALARHPRLAGLTTLGIETEEPDTPADAVGDLLAWPGLPNCDDLTLACPEWTGSMIAPLATPDGRRRWRRLSIAGAVHAEDSLRPWFEGRPWERLERLRFEGVFGLDREPSGPAGERFPWLTAFALATGEVPPNVAAGYVERLGPRLERLELECDWPSGGPPERLAHAISERPLRRLTMRDHHGTLLTGLPTTLEHLAVIRRVGDSIWPWLQGTALQTLGVRVGPTEREATALADRGALRALRTLDLFGFGSTDGLELLLARDAVPMMQGLSLYAPQPTALDALLAWPRLGQLRWLELSHITTAGLTKLAAAGLSPLAEVWVNGPVAPETHAALAARFGQRFVAGGRVHE